MNFLAHLHLAHLADSSLSGNLLADFVRGDPAGEWPADVVEGIFMHRRIWTQLSPELPLPEFVRYAHAQVSFILPDSPPRFVNLNEYLWSERWLERYRDMAFIQRVLNGMASRRPRLDALRDSWQDLDTHYDRLEQQFWRFYPQMMAQAKKGEL